jgi:hypothetical protein
VFIIRIISTVWQQSTGFINFKTGVHMMTLVLQRVNDPNFMDMTRVVDVIKSDTVLDTFGRSCIQSFPYYKL